jgi:hypothetical protein
MPHHWIQRGLHDFLAGVSGQSLEALGWDFLNQMVDEFDLADGLEERRGLVSGSESGGFWVVVGHVSETGDPNASVVVKYESNLRQVVWESTNDLLMKSRIDRSIFVGVFLLKHAHSGESAFR